MTPIQYRRLFNTGTDCGFCGAKTDEKHRHQALNGVVCTHCFGTVTSRYNPRFVELYPGDSRSIAVYSYQSEHNDSFKLFSETDKPPLVFVEPEVSFHDLDERVQNCIDRAITWDFVDELMELSWENATKEACTYFQAWNRSQDDLTKEQTQTIEREIEPPVFSTQRGLYSGSISYFKQTETEQATIV